MNMTEIIITTQNLVLIFLSTTISIWAKTWLDAEIKKQGGYEKLKWYQEIGLMLMGLLQETTFLRQMFNITLTFK